MLSNIRNSIRLVDRQPKKHIGWGDAWTSLTIQSLCGQESIAAPRLSQTRRDRFMQVEKSTDRGYQQNWSFQPNTIGLARLYIFTELLDDLEHMKRFWHLRKKALEYTLWRNYFWRDHGPIARQTTEWLRCFHFARLRKSMKTKWTGCRVECQFWTSEWCRRSTG